ncbi:hypothetical protein BJ138DRAFT_1109492 [Hygrophoropsis aurantiaca]|uniref:Uncharacterized protein n=1 Tax=Hygrophoropsis aurantiaca TaxID=72124 RepID=A0ACB8ARP5_9AGAM|nr:hypothetical protein BJ138DRAFT_1109492 [Hygrophoropsis aurantiaca]
MSPSTKKTGVIKLKVPRHNAQRVGDKFTSHLTTIARKQGARVVTYQPNFDGPNGNAMALAMESASEWNSLLITARAERGPQWDVGTQQFLVDYGSELHYDPSPLLEFRKQERATDENMTQHGHLRRSMQPPEYLPSGHDAPRMTRNHSSSSQFQAYGGGSPRHPPGFSNAPFNGIPPSHFYGTSGVEAQSPARMGMGAMGASMSPDVRRRSTRGIHDDGFISLHGP